MDAGKRIHSSYKMIQAECEISLHLKWKLRETEYCSDASQVLSDVPLKVTIVVRLGTEA